MVTFLVVVPSLSAPWVSHIPAGHCGIGPERWWRRWNSQNAQTPSGNCDSFAPSVYRRNKEVKMGFIGKKYIRL